MGKGGGGINLFCYWAARNLLTANGYLRKNLYSPGMHIPVVLEEDVTVQPEVYYVLAWNFKKEILARYKDLVERCIEFYFPINPEV